MTTHQLILSDLHCYTESHSVKSFLRHLLLTPGSRYMTYMRLASSYRNGKRLEKIAYYYLRSRVTMLQGRHGVRISPPISIGKGFYIGHFGTIVISPLAIIGDNVNISQGVTIGYANRGGRKGAMTIGNEVYTGPGAKIVGRVTIGNNVAIGANAMVTHDVPDSAVVGGVPARIISYDGAIGYINRKA